LRERFTAFSSKLLGIVKTGYHRLKGKGNRRNGQRPCDRPAAYLVDTHHDSLWPRNRLFGIQTLGTAPLLWGRVLY